MQLFIKKSPSGRGIPEGWERRNRRKSLWGIRCDFIMSHKEKNNSPKNVVYNGI
jgi:hypothetical protein